MVAAVAVVIALCITGAPGGRVEGVGPRVDVVRPIAGAPQAVSARGPLHLEVVAGEGPAEATVSAEGNLQPMVKLAVADGVLQVDVVGDPVSARGIVVRITMPPPTSIVASGAVRVTTPLRGSARAEASGAARLTVSGTPTSLAIHGRGASSVDATAVTVDTAVVEIAGASEVDVGPATTLTVAGGGVGRVRYRGDPMLRTKVAPTVKVTRMRP